MKRLVLSLVLPLILSAGFVFAQTSISYNGSGNYMLRERTDLRRYDNGKYIGLVSREVSSFIIPVSSENGYLYEGNFFVQQKTQRAMHQVGAGIDDSIPSVFKINSEGDFSMIEDYGYPSFRSFPTFPKNKVKPGDTWNGQAVRAVDPLDKGISTRIPFYVQYTYLRDEEFHGESVYLLNAKWATRYGYGSGTSYVDYNGDKELSRADGSHTATIYVSKKSGNMLVMRDSVDETFTYSDGKKIQFKGTIALFTEYPPAIENSKKTEIINYTRQIAEENNIDIEETAAGIKLAIRNLQFKPNSPELENGEAVRLDQIARVLKTTDAKLLVEGHTARTGEETGEQELSEERARAIAQALSERGIKTGRFICKGWGGRKPIDTNDTAEGRARNRRVEITILD
ncbi:MAG: OmpA family protein [Treponema sp.]|nr:OmpA family protein [Treponema sp.]